MGEHESAGVRNYRDLVAWQAAMDLAEQTYRATEAFPKAEQFGLTAQLRRSAVSVPSNIAEGFGRRKPVEFRRFLDIAKGSLFEFQTQAELARRMGWLKGDPLSSLRDLAGRADALVSGLRRSIDTTKT
jgi:four helix bundle protein